MQLCGAKWRTAQENLELVMRWKGWLILNGRSNQIGVAFCEKIRPHSAWVPFREDEVQESWWHHKYVTRFHSDHCTSALQTFMAREKCWPVTKQKNISLFDIHKPDWLINIGWEIWKIEESFQTFIVRQLECFEYIKVWRGFMNLFHRFKQYYFSRTSFINH